MFNLSLSRNSNTSSDTSSGTRKSMAATNDAVSQSVIRSERLLVSNGSLSQVSKQNLIENSDLDLIE